MKTVIKVENLGKQYRLGQIGTGTISHDLNRWWHRMRGKEDPYLKVGDTNDRTQKATSDFVWVLKDINFDVKQGEVVGIVGRNGAGKSTLLKILSRTTTPTLGQYSIKGRVASLLEVGTGFHPELSGRENIFLNGAIMGMTKREIRSKFDEIVAFSGVERYIDTPVKRYSSGMYVRLAFAVAAHLEPEILIVDEVLAVGDAEFQKKCLGKMKDVSDKDGRTVLFVSHNMAALKNLCHRAVLLKQGRVEKIDEIRNVIDYYMATEERPVRLDTIADHQRKFSTGEAFFRSIEVKSAHAEAGSSIPLNSPLSMNFSIDVVHPLKGAIMDVKVVSQEGVELSHSQSNMNNLDELRLDAGRYDIQVQIDNPFQPGNYFLTVGIHHSNGRTIDYLENILGFEVMNISLTTGEDYTQNWKHGYFRPNTQWKLEKTQSLFL